MPTLYLLVGIPGSGKSTWSKECTNAVRISRDEIRYSLLGENDSYFSKEDLVFKTYIEKIKENLKNGKNVIADATHLTMASRKKVYSKLNGYFDNLIAIYFDTPLQECLMRNGKRESRERVPYEQVINMSNSLILPSYDEPFDKILLICQNYN